MACSQPIRLLKRVRRNRKHKKNEKNEKMKKVGPDKNQRDIKWRGNGFLLPSYEILTRNNFLKR